MKLRLETSRLLLYRAGELHRSGKRCDDAVAMSKLWISEAAVQSGLDAMQIFGGAGVVSDTGRRCACCATRSLRASSRAPRRFSARSSRACWGLP